MKLLRPRSLPPTERPLVSVVIPCHNYGHFLPDAVAGALAQEHVDVEVIVVDDCSTDDSADVAAALAARHPEVTLVRNPVNLRHIATYNVGLARARGEYVALLSADDRLVPGALDRAAALFRAHPEVALVHGAVDTFGDVEPPPPSPARSWTVWSGAEWIARVCRSTDNPITNPEAIVRGDVVRRIGGYDPAYPYAADMLFWLRAATFGDVGRVNGSQAQYRIHGSNMHDATGLLGDLRERCTLIEDFLDDDATRSVLPETAEIRDASRLRFAQEALRYARSVLDDAHADDTPATGDATADADATALELIAFARETCPAIESTRAWRATHARLQGLTPSWRRRLETSVFRLRWAVRWQLKHRWGA